MRRPATPPPQRPHPDIAYTPDRGSAGALPMTHQPPKTMMLLGAYGQNNIGDDALLEVFLDELRPACLIVNSAQPEQTRLRYGVETLATYAGKPRLRRVRALLRADAIVFGGGSLLKEIEGSATKRLLYFLRIFVVLAIARLRDRPAAMLAVGMGPLRAPLYRWLALKAANATELICVRDAASRDLLLEIGVARPIHVTADPAFTLQPRVTDAPGSACRPTVAVIPRYSLTEAEIVALAAACDGLVERWAVRIVLLPFQTGYRAIYDDLPATEAIRAHMRQPAELCVPETPRAALDAIGRADLVLSARLHGLIFGAIQRRAIVGIDYEVKVGSFLHELGQDWASVSLAQLAAGELPAVLERAWTERAALGAAIGARTQQLQARSRETFTLFRALTAPQPEPPRPTRRLFQRVSRALFLSGAALLLAALMWSFAHAAPPTFSDPAQDQVRLILPSLRDSEAERAAGAYVPGIGATLVLDLIRGPNTLADKPSYRGVHDWAYYLMGAFGPRLDAVPDDEQIAISTDYYDFENRVYHQLVVRCRAGDVGDAAKYQAWLDGLPFDAAVARIEGVSAATAQQPAASTVAFAAGETTALSFDDPTQSQADWTALGGAWSFADGGYAQADLARYDLATLLNRTLRGDYRVSADVQYLAGDMGGGIIFNAPSGSAKNGAHMVSYSEKGTYLQWGRFDEAGVFQFTGGSPVPSGADGRAHRLAVAVTGSSFSVTLDGAELVRDVPLTGTAGGRIGLLASTSHVRFDNLTLETGAP